MSKKTKRPKKSKDDEPMLFVTTDARMKGGKLDPDDIAIIRDMRIVTPDEALELAEAEDRDKDEAPEDQEKPLPPGMFTLKPDQMKGLAVHANDALKEFETIAEALVIRLQLGDFVRKLRIDESCSWRAVARGMNAHVSQDRKLRGAVWRPPSNQLMGMALCKVAAETYDQDYMTPPWN